MELDAGIRNFLFLSRAIRQNSGNLAKVTTLDVLGAFLNYFFAFLFWDFQIAHNWRGENKLIVFIRLFSENERER